MTCPLCNGIGWLCEQHGIAWEHGDAVDPDCAGPGIPCHCNPQQRMPPGTRVLSSVAPEEPLDPEVKH